MVTQMLKSTCWLAAALLEREQPLSKLNNEEYEGLRRMFDAVPGEQQPCLKCPNYVWHYCSQNEVECDEFCDYADRQAGEGVSIIEDGEDA